MSRNLQALIIPILLIIMVLLFRGFPVEGKDRQILVFGGNGFLGAETLEILIEDGDIITMVNRGNWYWDSKTRILPHVRHIACDRKHPLETCPGLVAAVQETDRYEAVLDFSAFGSLEAKESAELLQNKTALYILISTDSVYDVCDKEHNGPTKETDSVRPPSQDEIEIRRHYHTYGHNKLEAEEEILKQRVESGFPFVILRLPDVIGPRDTTYRFWVYQLWLQLALALPEHPVVIPHFLQNYDLSFVYSKDVAKVIVQLLDMGPQVRDQAINLAYPETVTLEKLLKDIQSALGLTEGVLHFQDATETNHMYFYPSVRRGPVDTTKAKSLLDWQPTPWASMLQETVQFYEAVMREDMFAMQRDEIVQVIGKQVFGEDVLPMHEALEKIYNIDLKHFKRPRDEL